MDYSPNDILDLQLEYKNDQQVLELVGTIADLQDQLSDADETSEKLTSAEKEVSDLKDEVRELELKLEEADRTICRLEDENDDLTEKLEECGGNLV
jgi:predicted  nucleic acid-binding Zn-ribbon protein